MARSIFRGSPSERAKSQPVPRGITAISMPSRSAIPFTTSCTDPSPPTTTSSSAPSAAARRPALVLVLVRVVEDVARDDGPDVHRLANVLGRVHGSMDELPARGRAVRLVPDEVIRGAVVGDRGQRDDQVAERVMRLEPS